MNKHIFKSDYYIWAIEVRQEDDRTAHLTVESSLTGKRKGKRNACVLDIYNIDPESPHGQWIRALQTTCYGCSVPFVDWVKSFYVGREKKIVTVDFRDKRLICGPGVAMGEIFVRPHDTHIELASTPR